MPDPEDLFGEEEEYDLDMDLSVLEFTDWDTEEVEPMDEWVLPKPDRSFELAISLSVIALFSVAFFIVAWGVLEAIAITAAHIIAFMASIVVFAWLSVTWIRRGRRLGSLPKSMMKDP